MDNKSKINELNRRIHKLSEKDAMMNKHIINKLKRKIKMLESE